MNPEENFQEQEVIQEKQEINVLTSVTPLSKYLALALFIAMPFIGGYIGYQYSPEKVVEVERVVIKEVEKVAELSVPDEDSEEVEKMSQFPGPNDGYEYIYEFHYPIYSDCDGDDVCEAEYINELIVEGESFDLEVRIIRHEPLIVSVGYRKTDGYWRERNWQEVARFTSDLESRYGFWEVADSTVEPFSGFAEYGQNNYNAGFASSGASIDLTIDDELPYPIFGNVWYRDNSTAGFKIINPGRVVTGKG